MNEDELLERIRDDAGGLRVDGDASTHARIRVRVQERITREASVIDVLGGWLRPALAAFSAAVLLCIVSLLLLEEPLVDEMFVEPTVTQLSEDYYRVAE